MYDTDVITCSIHELQFVFDLELASIDSNLRCKLIATGCVVCHTNCYIGVKERYVTSHIAIPL